MSQLKEIWFGRKCAQMPRTLNSTAFNRAPIISHDKQVHLVKENKYLPAPPCLSKDRQVIFILASDNTLHPLQGLALLGNLHSASLSVEIVFFFMM